MKDKITKWIKKQVQDAKAEGIVMGLSGGVDSAVVAALSKSAVGKDKLLCLFMPCHSHGSDVQDANMVARNLGIKLEEVDLSKAFDALIEILPGSQGIARNNLKPRLRMLTLYYFANKLNYIVCGTGNESECMAGYFTKYGDGGVDILPIGDLLKKQVRKLAAELGIPQAIIDKPPTAGLWPGQTDEGEMGITYDELDDILERLKHGKKQVSSVEKVRKVKEMIRRSAHKRQGPQACPV
jgi:NAD+ synthase